MRILISRPLVLALPLFIIAFILQPGLAAEPKPMDGVNIEAVETYPNVHRHELGLGVGLYPFNAYYMGVLLTGSYLYNFNPTFSWEVLNLNYAYSVQNDLTTELADRYRVNPQTIKRLQLLMSTNIQYTILNGKFVALADYIRYFRTSAIGGLGLVNTREASTAAPIFGLRFQIYTGERFSWNFDVRDAIAVTGLTNYVTFTMGLGLGL